MRWCRTAARSSWTGSSSLLYLDGRLERRHRTVYQTLAVAPGLDIADNLFLGREERKKGVLGWFSGCWCSHMRSEANGT